jgi:hypothetical protein
MQARTEKMHVNPPNQAPEPVGQFWEGALQRIPTVFGRLVYIASLRDRLAGQYSQPPFDRLADAGDVDRGLNHAHERIFAQWLAFSLAEQKSELEEFLSSGQILPDYRGLAPSGAREVEVQLYLTDLELLLRFMAAGHGGV